MAAIVTAGRAIRVAIEGRLDQGDPADGQQNGPGDGRDGVRIAGEAFTDADRP